MAFDVRVNVAGLCAWADDGANGAVHVLMPVSSPPHPMSRGHGGDDAGMMMAMPRHFARLVYDAAYEQRNDRQLSLYRRCVSIDGKALEFQAASGDQFDATTPAELFDLRGRDELQPLPRSYVDAAPAAPVNSRVTFGTGRFTDRMLGHAHSLGAGAPMQLANNVEWTISGVPGDSLDLSSICQDLSGTLYPKGGLVQLYVFHAPGKELLQAAEGYPNIADTLHLDMYFFLDPKFPRSGGYPAIGGPFDSAVKANCTFDGSTKDPMIEREFNDDKTKHVVIRGVEYILPKPPLMVVYSQRLSGECGQGLVSLESR